MKKVLLIFLYFIIPLKHSLAQHWDFGASAGMMTTLQTGKFSGVTTANSAGHSYALDLQLNHTSQSGLMIAAGTEVARIITHRAGVIAGSPYNFATIVWGNPVVSIDLMMGYKLTLQKSALLVNAKVGYLMAEHFSNKVANAWEPIIYLDNDITGYSYGVDFEYHHRLNKTTDIGLKLCPEFVRFPSQVHLFCFGSLLSLHVKL